MAQAPTITYAAAAPVYQTMAAAAPVYLPAQPVAEAASVYLPAQARTVDSGIVPAVQLLLEELPQLVTVETPAAEPVVEAEVAVPVVVEAEAAAPAAAPVVEAEAAAPTASYAAQLVNLIRGGPADELAVVEAA